MSPDRARLEIINTEYSSTYEGCISNVTIEYEIRANAEYAISYINQYGSDIRIDLTASESTIGFHQREITVSSDIYELYIASLGGSATGTNFSSRSLDIDKCKTTGEIIKDEYYTDYSVMINNIDPSKQYKLYEYQDNGSLTDTGIDFNDNGIIEFPHYGLIDPTRVLELREEPGYVISSRLSGNNEVYDRILSNLDVRSNNSFYTGVFLGFHNQTYDENECIVSGDILVYLQASLYEPDDTSYNINIIDNECRESTLRNCGTQSLGAPTYSSFYDAYIFTLENIPIDEDNTTIAFMKRRKNRDSDCCFNGDGDPYAIALQRIIVRNCPNDPDNDDIPNASDNCPDTYNPNQEDGDSDGIGDVCDNCENISNSDQSDDDNDNVGDVCDNCPDESNSNQLDTDNDGLGDACDDDDDNDGILDINDLCPLIPSSNQDDDNDGIGNECDDIDNDALPNLKPSGLSVEVDGTTYDAYSSNNFTPKLKNGEQHEFTIKIENDDDGLAGTSRYELLVSTSNQYPNASVPYYTLRSDNIGNINPNSEESETFTVSVFGNSIAGMSLQANTTYYIHFEVDILDDIVESNETTNDNWDVIPFELDSNSGGRFYLNLGSNTLEINTDDFDNSPNGYINLKIYSLNGFIGPEENSSNNNTLIINQQITENQTIDISYLSIGTYAIHINDVYLSKFNKKK
ncbi:thrombospondin type 3 repeat-containing protein [Winogradskyella poriferorum]|uniref:thrombospondin type 3 repeat-containing protein n=1 Tax=Winogradskyella poriferorum TaxID=307627 RepID=UPI003D661CBE